MKLEDANKLTLQEACDYAMDKIVKQGGRCMINNSCAYGDDEGNHCAVGWLLDETNPALMEYEGGVGALDYELKEHMPNFFNEEGAIDALCDLQDVHDETSADLIKRKLKELSQYIDVDKPIYKEWLELRKAQEKAA